MPDRADIEQALAQIIASVVYPDGVTSASAVGVRCRVYRGWPTPRLIEEEIGQGVVHITVLSQQNTVRNRTRYPAEWQGSCPAPTLFVTTRGDVVSFSGDGGPGHLVGVRADGHSYVYRMQAGDTAGLVAAVLASQIRQDRPALAIGSDLHVLDAEGLVARVVTDGVGGREIRRQEAVFQTTFWCPDPQTRDDVVSAIDTRLADMPLIDVTGWACRLRFVGDRSSDENAGAGVWRRDLFYSVEYPTVSQEVLPAMIFGVVDVNDVPFIG